MELQGTTVSEGWVRKQRCFIILRVFCLFVFYLHWASCICPLTKCVSGWTFGTVFFSSLCSLVLEPGGACVVWSSDLSLWIMISLVFLLALPPGVGSLLWQVFILQLFFPLLSTTPPPHLPPSHFISLSPSLCLCQQQPLLDTAVCFLSPFLCLHLSLSPSALARLLSSICWSVCLLSYHSRCF